MADTGARSPVANGEDYNQWDSPSYAYSSNDQYAFANAVNYSHDYYNFDFSIPAGSIDGIVVSLEGHAYSALGADIYTELSWDGGSSYTSTGYYAHYTGTSDETDVLGGAADTWGRTWAVSEFSNANFRVRVRSQPSGGTRPYLDHISVTVYYTEAAAGQATRSMHQFRMRRVD